MDKALQGYAAKGGYFVEGRVKKRNGKHVFGHTMEFPCVKQPPGSPREAFYALHQMRAFVRDARNSALPSSLQAWATTLARIQDDELKQEWYRIQNQFATIICEDVLKRGGIFHQPVALSNREVEARLTALRDDRVFNTKKGALPFPEHSSKNLPEDSSKKPR